MKKTTLDKIISKAVLNDRLNYVNRDIAFLQDLPPDSEVVTMLYSELILRRDNAVKLLSMLERI